VQGNIDEHHKKFPWQAGIGTEESNTGGTRGIYETDKSLCHMAPTNRMPENVGTESGWQFYAGRPFLSGLFFWTGFDYRGEPTPYDWPAISSQFGLIDLCGFPKDIFYYLKAWWDKDPLLHISPHWNWKGQEGRDKKVAVYSNCEQVELFLNNKKLGLKDMPVNGHLEWIVPYRLGTLMAKGYTKGKPVLNQKIETTSEPGSIQLIAGKSIIKANGTDVSVITVQAVDLKGRLVPDANNEITFSIEGSGKILGVGNGDPSSHEADQYLEIIKTSAISNLKELAVDKLDNRPEVISPMEGGNWKPAFKEKLDWTDYRDTLLVVRGSFTIDSLGSNVLVKLYTKSILENQSIYVNGKLIAQNVKRDAPDQAYTLDHSILKQGENVYAVLGQRFRKKYKWDEPNTDPGLVQMIYPAKEWKRKLFKGYAQIIVQSSNNKAPIQLSAQSPGLKPGELTIQVE
jgi:beta-galactosidase